jgi:NhaP-type Na+/H+ or K+/H+ antiporter
VLVYAIARSWALNEFLAAFTAGVALSAVSAPMGEAFKPLGDLIAEVIKLAAILLFGALLAYEVGSVDRRDLAFVAAALLAVRPPALLLSLSATPLPWRERIAVAWFGPKGFASIFFGVMILRTAGGEADRVFRLIALVVAASIVVHSSSDVVVARALERRSR